MSTCLEPSLPILSGSIPQAESQLIPREDAVVKDFAKDLEDALGSLQASINEREKSQQDLDALVRGLKNRSFFSALKAKATSKDTEDAYKVLQRLGLSLQLTQSVLDIMLQVQSQKNKVLHAFNKALVEKIEKIQGDTDTLDSNQKEAALIFLDGLREQIQDQIYQQEIVESHEARLQGIDEWKHFQQELSGRQDQSLMEFGEWKKLKDAESENILARVVQLERVAGTYASHIARLESRLALLERLSIEARSLKAVLVHNSPAAAALLVGAAALIIALK